MERGEVCSAVQYEMGQLWHCDATGCAQHHDMWEHTLSCPKENSSRRWQDHPGCSHHHPRSSSTLTQPLPLPHCLHILRPLRPQQSCSDLYQLGSHTLKAWHQQPNSFSKEIPHPHQAAAVTLDWFIFFWIDLSRIKILLVLTTVE